MANEHELEKLRAELEELKKRHSFLLSAVDHLPNPIFMKDEEARFFFFNRAYSDFFGMKRQDYYGKTVLDLDYLPMEDRERFQREDIKRIADEDVISYDTVFQAADNVEHPSFYWSRGFRDKKTDRHGLVGEIVDITNERTLQKKLDESLEELKKANEKLQVMAKTDHASGLYNRTVLWEKGKTMTGRGAADTTKSCMIMFDLDHFKVVNDEFGHLKGDEVLSRFAEILRNECRPSDMPIRYGGDEFLLILNNVTLDIGIKVAERIRARCEKEMILPSGRTITVSIGVIEVDEKETFENNLSRLDAYLYNAKEMGRNRVVSRIA